MASTLLFASLLSFALSKQYDVVWTKQGVADLNHKIAVSNGDKLRFICPFGSHSTIWYLVTRDQYDGCDCGSDTCLRPAFCPGLITYNYTVDIVRNSEELGNAQDYQPGRTYYFASFSNGYLGSSDKDNGGECVSDQLKLEIEVSPADSTGGDTDSSVDPPTGDTITTPGNTGGEGEEEEEEEEVSGSALKPDVPNPDNISGLTPSSSLSSAATLSSILVCTVLALVMRH